MPERDRKLNQELNRQTIYGAMEGLLNNDQVIENGEAIYLPVSLIEGNFALLYLRENFIESKPLPFDIETLIINPRKDINIARRVYKFYLIDGAISISSWSETEVSYQSRGYGAGLFSCTNIVIEDVIKRVPDLKGKKIISEINDVAEGLGAHKDRTPVIRKGWSSHQARMLGYSREGLSSWQKQF